MEEAGPRILECSERPKEMDQFRNKLEVNDVVWVLEE